MLRKPEGLIIRDIEIEKLELNREGPISFRIVMTKNRIAYRKTVYFPHGYHGTYLVEGQTVEKELEITPEQFAKLSDSMHNAGLLELLQNQSEKQSLVCEFDDGAHYEYRPRRAQPVEFERIASILMSFCESEKMDEKEHENARNSVKKLARATDCCGAVMLKGWEYCPKCGKPAACNEEKTAEYDMDETSWTCSTCGESIPFQYKYCGRCGAMRRF